MSFEDGFYPGAVRRTEVPLWGYPGGTHGQNRPLMIVNHIMDGWKSTLDNAQWRKKAGVGVHFGIGRDGSASQYTSIWDAHWGNGISGNKAIDRTNPNLAYLESIGQWVPVPYAGGTAWALVRQGVNVFNSHSISKEHEGKPDMAWTQQMFDTSIAIDKWCIEACKWRGAPLKIDPYLQIRHAQIDPVNRASCPGPNWPRAASYEAVKEEPPAEPPPPPQEDEDMLIYKALDTGSLWLVGSDGKRRVTPEEAGRLWADGVRVVDRKEAEIGAIADSPAQWLNRNSSVPDGKGGFITVWQLLEWSTTSQELNRFNWLIKENTYPGLSPLEAFQKAVAEAE